MAPHRPWLLEDPLPISLAERQEWDHALDRVAHVFSSSPSQSPDRLANARARAPAEQGDIHQQRGPAAVHDGGLGGHWADAAGARTPEHDSDLRQQRSACAAAVHGSSPGSPGGQRTGTGARAPEHNAIHQQPGPAAVHDSGLGGHGAGTAGGGAQMPECDGDLSQQRVGHAADVHSSPGGQRADAGATVPQHTDLPQRHGLATARSPSPAAESGRATARR
eukprot:9478710-Pyramimonas_sp.AAC.1